MAGTTTNFAIPYPSVTDYVTNGATDMRTLAEKVDAVMSSGTPARNLLINGAMQVSQRTAVGTAVTGITASGYYTADRWNVTNLTLGTWTNTNIADAPTGSGFTNSFKMQCTTADAAPAAGDALIVQQVIEAQNLQALRKGTASAQTMTLSFWVKSFQTGTFIVELLDAVNTRSYCRAYTVTTSGTWQYVTIPIAADIAGVVPNTNAQGIQLNFWLGAGSTWTSGTLQTTWGGTVSANRAVGQTNVASSTSNYWQMTGAQLTVGSVSVPFQFKSYADDLRDCERYYKRTTQVGAGGTIARMLPSGYQAATDQTIFAIIFAVPMRSAPTVSSTGTQVSDDVTYATNILTLAITDASGTTAKIVIVHAVSGAQFRPAVLRANTTTAFFDFSAEL